MWRRRKGRRSKRKMGTGGAGGRGKEMGKNGKLKREREKKGEVRIQAKKNIKVIRKRRESYRIRGRTGDGKRGGHGGKKREGRQRESSSSPRPPKPSSPQSRCSRSREVGAIPEHVWSHHPAPPGTGAAGDHGHQDIFKSNRT